MKNRFDEQLNELNKNLIIMGGLIECAIAKATKALIDGDISLANEIMENDTIIDDKEKEIEAMCLKLLLIHQPVARDLRQISTALKMLTDLERIGDQAADISELCEYINDTMRQSDYIREMAKAVINMVTFSIDSFVRKDLSLAKSVINQDDTVDNLFMKIKNDLLLQVRENPEVGESAFDMLQVAKYYERIGDHAENIAEWVIFSITGIHKNKQLL
ncbi:MAG: phosphate signaling complex protein PhoU [Ruminococcus sp.]|jgi:phosphate transport system protein|nr:phosphate signaling complex protein PhoU [Ruminococcus sp.]